MPTVALKPVQIWMKNSLTAPQKPCSSMSALYVSTPPLKSKCNEMMTNAMIAIAKISLNKTFSIAVFSFVFIFWFHYITTFANWKEFFVCFRKSLPNFLSVLVGQPCRLRALVLQNSLDIWRLWCDCLKENLQCQTRRWVCLRDRHCGCGFSLLDSRMGVQVRGCYMKKLSRF